MSTMSSFATYDHRTRDGVITDPSGGVSLIATIARGVTLKFRVGSSRGNGVSTT